MTSKTGSPYRTLSDLRAANAAAGFHFFARDTMKWWRSRVESTLIRGRYFITSEDEFALDGRRPERIYTVRFANDNASIDTMRSYLRSKDNAREFIRLTAKGEHVRRNCGTCKICGNFGSGCTGTFEEAC